ncbi:hypothetical protein niasHS_016850 [Heterodera schachtii]|uniref:Major sperm protein n=1 Tax=Heterodera schachtii TaxID=97005 RepID=A0ABD2HUA2_HETSC
MFSTITHQTPTKPARQQQQWRNFHQRTSQQCPRRRSSSTPPFDKLATAWVVVTNPGTKRIGYNFKTATRRAGSAFKTTKPKRINTIPPNGTLGPKKSVKVAITCDAFKRDSEDTKGDRGVDQNAGLSRHRVQARVVPGTRNGAQQELDVQHLMEGCFVTSTWT